MAPQIHWANYVSDFYHLSRISGYLSYISMALCVFLLISFAALPVEKTRRNYLNVCLLISMTLFELGIVVPFTRKPDPCHDLITPNDAHSSMTCAWSGGLLVFGGAAISLWVLLRAISMHLQICWDIVPGPSYYWIAQAIGWLLSAALLAIEMSVTGTSVRFGDICHVNTHNSIGSWWAPLLTFTGLSLVMQLLTFAYCLKVYLRHTLASTPPETESSQGGSVSHRSANARAVFRRVKNVLKIQWRGIAIAVVIVANVIFFSVVFVVVDARVKRAAADLDTLLPWITCIVLTQDKNECLSKTGPLAVNQSLLIATLILLSVGGIELFLLVCTWDMLTGWYILARKLLTGRHSGHDFVSLHEPTHTRGKDGRQMLSYGSPERNAASPEAIGGKSGAIVTPSFVTPLTRIENTDYRQAYGPHGDDERSYSSPKRSFSNPRPPSSRSPGVGWDNKVMTLEPLPEDR